MYYRERDTETDRQTDRDRDRDRDKTETETRRRQRQRETETDRQTDRHSQKHACAPSNLERPAAEKTLRHAAEALFPRPLEATRHSFTPIGRGSLDIRSSSSPLFKALKAPRNKVPARPIPESLNCEIPQSMWPFQAISFTILLGHHSLAYELRRTASENPGFKTPNAVSFSRRRTCSLTNPSCWMVSNTLPLSSSRPALALGGCSKQRAMGYGCIPRGYATGPNFNSPFKICGPSGRRSSV